MLSNRGYLAGKKIWRWSKGYFKAVEFALEVGAILCDSLPRASLAEDG